MFVPILSIPCRRHASSTRHVLARVDDVTHEAETLDLLGARHVVRIDPSDCSDPLLEIVHARDGIVRIECEVETRTNTIVEFVISVDRERFSRMVASGRVPSEEHLVSLLRNVWREVVPLTNGNDNADGNDADGVTADEYDDMQTDATDAATARDAAQDAH